MKLKDMVTIEFPKKLNILETHNLMYHLNQEMNTRIDYTLNSFHSIDRNAKARVDGSLYLEAFFVGSPQTYEGIFSSDSDGDGSIKQITFRLIPDYDLNDYTSIQQNTWNDTRNSVESYFQREQEILEKVNSLKGREFSLDNLL